jgi:hypothetical protein
MQQNETKAITKVKPVETTTSILLYIKRYFQIKNLSRSLLTGVWRRLICYKITYGYGTPNSSIGNLYCCTVHS